MRTFCASCGNMKLKWWAPDFCDFCDRDTVTTEEDPRPVRLDGLLNEDLQDAMAGPSEKSGLWSRLKGWFS